MYNRGNSNCTVHHTLTYIHTNAATDKHTLGELEMKVRVDGGECGSTGILEGY